MKIGTHNGIFHADDAFACAMLHMLGEGGEIVRTRDPSVLEDCNFLVDVGGVHDGARRRFDHHQKGGAGTRDNGVPYASAGLVWCHYWADILGMASRALGVSLISDGSFGSHKGVADRVDRALIQGVDAADCGHSLFEGGVARHEGIRATSISAAVSGMNPTWLEASDFDRAFACAVEFAQGVLLRVIASAVAAERAQTEFLRACEGDGPIVELDRFLPWAHELQVPDGKLLVVYPSVEGTWMVQCVPPHPGSFGQRLPLPASWAGLRDAVLCRLTGVGDAVFCHTGRFICGAQSREGAIALARLAIQQ